MSSALVATNLPTAADLITADEELRLGFILDALYRRVLAETHALVLTALDLDPATFRVDDAATTELLAEAANRDLLINETMRHAITAKLQEGQAAGLTTREIADSIDALLSKKGRAETIARTEVAHAQVRSAVNRYKASGLVDRVYIRDGDQDSPCKERNGTVVPLDEAPDLAHPRCTLLVIPRLRDDM